MLVKLLSVTLRTIHFVLFLFMSFGWIISFRWVSAAYVVIVPLVIFHWWTNDGACILTEWDNRLRGITTQRDLQRGQFIKGVLKRFFGCVPNDWVLKISVYLLLIIGLAVAARRL